MAAAVGTEGLDFGDFGSGDYDSAGMAEDQNAIADAEQQMAADHVANMDTLQSADNMGSYVGDSSTTTYYVEEQQAMTMDQNATADAQNQMAADHISNMNMLQAAENAASYVGDTTYVYEEQPASYYSNDFLNRMNAEVNYNCASYV